MIKNQNRAVSGGIAASGGESTLERVSSKSKLSRVVLIDDHAILREGLIALCNMEHDLEVVGQAATLTEAIAVAEATQPDLIVTDLALAGATGLQGIVEFRSRIPAAKVLVLTMHDSEEYIRAAISAGAHGYVLKDATREELIKAMRAVLAGRRYLCSHASARIVRSYLGEQTVAPPIAAGVTGREREILAMIAAGLSNKKIASQIKRSVKTVEKHRANFMRKLHLHNVADVTRYAMQTGLVMEKDEAEAGRTAMR
jgi:DNA-binding NarL/FixJ family response regulator